MSRVEAQAKRKKEKKGGIGAWIYRIIILILLGVMLFSGYNIWRIYSEYEEGKVIYEDLADDVGAGKLTGIDNSRLHLDWTGLQEKNKDVCAWIRCKDTVLNYPIVSGENWDSAPAYNDHYLVTTITGENNGKGTLFVDHSCDNPFRSFLTIIYGHRMKDGSMFKLLTEYFGDTGPAYYEKHPTFELYTPKKNFDIHIFACAKVDETDTSIYKYNFLDAWGEVDEEAKQAYLDRIKEVDQFMANPDVEVTSQDLIVMMSTCTAELDDYRLVVWGKLVPVD